MTPANVAAKQVFQQVALLLCLSAAGGALTKAFHPRSPAWYLIPDTGEFAVTEAAVRERWNGEVLWVDARSAKAYQKRHREGAVPLNEEQWNDLLGEHFNTLASAGKPLVVYCDGTRCQKSKAVAEKLRNLGIPDVFYLSGGWRG